MQVVRTTRRTAGRVDATDGLFDEPDEEPPMLIAQACSEGRTRPNRSCNATDVALLRV
jgi:hypothetical protein